MDSRRRWHWTAILACVITALALAGTPAAARCRKVHGRIALESASGAACASPIGICATGSFRGSVSGVFSFTGTSLTPTVDTPTTSVVLLTGDNLIQTRDGDLMTKDAVVLRATGTGDFAEVDTIIGGTGAWAGATGSLTATGTFTAAGGRGEYAGEVCTP
jgi:hypothetical protein